MAAQEASHISQLAKHVSSMGSVATSFKQAAGEHNKSIAKVIKDVSAVFANNKTNFNDLTSSVNSLNTQSQQTATKIENTNSILQTSIQIQQNMLSTLKDIKKSLEDDKGKKDGDSGGGIGGALKTFGQKILGAVASRAGIVAAGAGAVGAAGLGAFERRNMNPQMPGPSSGPGADASSVGGSDPGRNVVKVLEAGRGYNVVQLANGQIERRTGDYAWRNNNPGNMQYDQIAARFGGMKAPGSDFAIFPNQEAGDRTRAYKLFERAGTPGAAIHSDMTVAQQIRKWAPPNVVQNGMTNDTEKYLNQILQAIGGMQYANTRGRDLTPEQRKAYMDAMRKIEGVRQGRTEVLRAGDPNWRPSNPTAGASQPQTAAVPNPSQPQGQGAAPDATPQQQPGATPATTPQQGEGQQAERQQQQQQTGGRVIEDQMREAATRKLPISDKLRGVLQKAADEAGGVTVRVKSGGQPPSGSGGRRTGSTRHDDGNAADLDLYMGDRKLIATNREDQAIFKKFVAAASAAGATGIGAGEGYMDPTGSRIHVGFGTSAIWGRDKSNRTAANWLREAVGGTPGGGQYAAGGPPSAGYGMAGGPGGAAGGPGGAAGAEGVGEITPQDAAMLQRFHGISVMPTVGGGMMPGMGMGPMPGMMPGMGMMGGMGMNPLAMLGGAIGGGKGFAIGGLASMLLGGLSQAGSMMGPSRERANMLQQNAVQQSALDDRARQAALRESEENNGRTSQQQSGNQRAQNNGDQSSYNNNNDMRVSDNSFFGDLMRSGMFSEQTKNLQFTA